MVDLVITAQETGDYGYDSEVPSVFMTLPIGVVPYGSVYTVDLFAADDRGVSYIRLYRDGVLLQDLLGAGPFTIDQTADSNVNVTRVYSAFAVDDSNNTSQGAFGSVTIGRVEDPWAVVTAGGKPVNVIYAAYDDDPLVLVLASLLDPNAVHALVEVTSSEPQVVEVGEATDVTGRLVLRFRGRGVSILRFRSTHPDDGRELYLEQRVVVGDNIPGGRVKGLQVLNPPTSMRVGDPPYQLRVFTADGVPLPLKPAATVSVRAPARVRAPASFGNGELSITPISEGDVSMTIRYSDGDGSEASVRLDFSVGPKLESS